MELPDDDDVDEVEDALSDPDDEELVAVEPEDPFDELSAFFESVLEELSASAPFLASVRSASLVEPNDPAERLSVL